MCLYLEQGYKEKIAEEDVVCYKVLMIRSDKYVSPYNLKYVWNVSSDNIVTDKYDTPTIDKFSNYYKLRYWFHTFKDLCDAEELCKFMGRGKNKIFKCVIPKGTAYYEGFQNVYREYASKCLRIIEKID